jgi:hypothetical protein
MAATLRVQADFKSKENFQEKTSRVLVAFNAAPWIREWQGFDEYRIIVDMNIHRRVQY